MLGLILAGKLTRASEFRGQILGSTARNFFYDPNTDNDPYRTGNGVSFDYQYSYEAKNYGFEFGGEGVTRDFRVDTGFTGQTNTLSNFLFGYLSSDPKPKALIIRRSISGSFGIDNDFYGRLQGWGLSSNINLGFKGSAQFGGGINFGRTKLYEDEFGPKRNATQNGAFFGTPFRETYRGSTFLFFFKSFNKRVSMSANYSMGFNSFDFDFGAGRRFPRVSPAALADPGNPLDPGPGRSMNIRVGGDFRPTDNFSFSLSYGKSNLRRNDTDRLAFDSNIFSFRSTYQFSRFVNFKVRLDYNTLSSRVFGQYTFAWTPSPGKALYVGYNDSYNYQGFAFSQQQSGFLQLNRTFFIKLSYLFRKSF